MANKFQLKRTTVSGRTPNTTNSGNSAYIDIGELALNLTDRKLFSSNGSSSFEVGSNLSNISVSGNATLYSIVANGSLGSPGDRLASNGTSIYWSAGGAGSGVSNVVFYPANSALVVETDTGNLSTKIQLPKFPSGVYGFTNSFSVTDSFGSSFDSQYDCNLSGVFFVEDLGTI